MVGWGDIIRGRAPTERTRGFDAIYQRYPFLGYFNKFSALRPLSSERAAVVATPPWNLGSSQEERF